MTREEAYRLAMRACEETWNEKTCKQIKEALEKESALDKIRTEIQATIGEERTGKGNINKGVVIGLQMALDTIYKYKAEIKPQENCDTCKHKDDGWDSEHCDGCCGNHSGFEPQESEGSNAYTN